MTTMAKRLDEKDPVETVPLTWDFTDDVVALGNATFSIIGAAISYSVDNSLFRGKDPALTIATAGAPQVSGLIVMQMVTGGTDGVDYKVACDVTIDSTPAATLRKVSVLPVRTQ